MAQPCSANAPLFLFVFPPPPANFYQDQVSATSLLSWIRLSTVEGAITAIAHLGRSRCRTFSLTLGCMGAIGMGMLDDSYLCHCQTCQTGRRLRGDSFHKL